MTLDEYQNLALRTANFGADQNMALAILALGLAGESGETADHIKKHVGHGHPLDVAKVAKELGDVLWYVSVMAKELGYPLEQIATINVAKLKARYPQGFTHEASINRENEQ